MAQPYTKDDLMHAEMVVQALHGLNGYDFWAECIAKVIAAERERCAAALRSKAELMTNSLHCGDSSGTIADTHRAARGLHYAASLLAP